jgi:hypothetical protein
MSAGLHEALYRAFLLRCMSPNLADIVAEAGD